MCGIGGFLNFAGRPAERDVIEALTVSMAHRGPDGQEVFIDGVAALGHRRLAIIDLIGGRQPMRNDTGDAWLVANGEIYNYRELRRSLRERGHRFRTEGDCEVILHGYAEWGVAVVERLRGMFAFAIWDGKRQQLVLARDRLGIKPLCFLKSQRRFAFASEIQALKVLPEFDASTNLNAIDQFLHLQYIPAPVSAYRQVEKLAPGHTMVVDADGQIEGPKRYWRFQWNTANPLPESECVDALDAALQDAVKSHLVADVPFGAFLSGGVDSSTIVAFAARELDLPLRTFCVGFDLPTHDERAFARRVAEIVGTDHQEQELGLDALELLPTLVRHYGEPFADSSAVCTWRVCEAARRQVSMVLSGDGGDEAFAGYSYFGSLVDQYSVPSGGLRRTRRAVGNLARSLGLLSPLPDVADAWYGRSPFFSDALRRQLWLPEFRDLPDSTQAWNTRQFAATAGTDVLDRCQQVEMETYLPFDNLAKVDIASMAHGLEVRVPLLDHVLLETVARIPSSVRLRKQTTLNGANSWSGKHVLKQVAARRLPMDLLERPKMGFSVPVGEWLAGTRKPWVRERLLGAGSRFGEWFDTGVVERMVGEHGVSADHGHRLWALLVLAEWQRPSNP